MKKKILVVDDSLDILDIIRTLLESSDYEVITASDGEQGMEKTKSTKPDLIILDVMMPKMDGYTFIKTKKCDQDIKDIPVIILTGKSEMADLFMVEGVGDYLIKPFDHKVLLGLVAKHLSEDK